MAAAVVALQRLRHCKMDLLKQPLAARLSWLQTQAFTTSCVGSDAIVTELVKRQWIKTSTDGITYDLPAVSSSVSSKAQMLKDAEKLVETLCPSRVVSITLGHSETQPLRKDDLRKVVMGWCNEVVSSPAMTNLCLTEKCFDMKKASLANLNGEAKVNDRVMAKTRAKNLNAQMQLNLQFRIAAPSQTASLFCDEVHRVAKAFIRDAGLKLGLKQGAESKMLASRPPSAVAQISEDDSSKRRKLE
jgi:hypothetical protein